VIGSILALAEEGDDEYPDEDMIEPSQIWVQFKRHREILWKSRSFGEGANNCY